MQIRKLCKVGNSYMVSLPREMLKYLEIQAGDYVNVHLAVENIQISRNAGNPYRTSDKGRRRTKRRK